MKRWLVGLCAALALGAASTGLAQAQPVGVSEPELVEAWVLLGDEQRALREAQALVSAGDPGWRDHVAYIDAAVQSHLRWAVIDEYRWLSQQHTQQPELLLLAAWATAAQAQGAALDEALVELERAAVGQDTAGPQLLARGLMRAGENERAAALLEGARNPAAQRLRVQALVGAGAHREAATLVLEALEQHPRHPGVAAALWQRGVPKAAVRRARGRALARAEALLDSDDPVVLLSAWQVLARARQLEGAQRAADGIAAAVPGLSLPPRLPYGSIMLEHLGQGMAHSGQALAQPELTPQERARVAAVRARTLRDDGLVDQARRAYREAIDLAGAEAELLLEAAALHLDVEPQRSLEWVGQALLVLACEPGLDLAGRRSAIVRGLELQAASLRALEQHDQALSFQLVASMLQPSAEGLVQLAQIQERQGGPEAALESLALAAALGSQHARSEMERLYRGPASVDALIEAARRDLALWAAAPAPAPSAPERLLGGRVLATSAGDLSFEALEGQVVVLVFWASWCAPCAQELPLVAQLQGGWQAQELPVRVIAISVDDTEADYRRGAKRFAELDITLAWAPELARTLQVEAVPATRLLDQQGRASGRLQGFHEGHAQRLDDLVRSLLLDESQPAPD